MCLKRKLHLLIIIILSGSKVFADGCNVDGMWFDPMNSNMEYSLSQNGTTFTGKSKYIDDKCGAFILSGTINNNTVSFEATSEKSGQGPECEIHERVSGTFGNNCTLLKGTTTDDKNSDEFNLYREPIKITSLIPASEFVISAEPRMPSFRAAAEVYIPSSMTFMNNLLPRTNESPFTWKVKIKHELPKRIVEGELNETVSNDGVYEPDFSQLKWLLGGKLTLSVQYFHTMRDENTYIIKGTNPGKTRIEEIVTSPILRQIACMESRYKQFEAKREGGTGFPVVGVGKNGVSGGIGIFQAYIPRPEDHEIWNWKDNVLYGIRTFESKKEEIRKKMAKKELNRLNKERKKQGLPLCAKDSIPPLNEEQTEREALRRYNGCREFQWELTDSKSCEGKWVVHPTIWGACLPDYVNDVLNCSLDG